MKSQGNKVGVGKESVVSELMPKDIEYQAAHWLAVLDGDEPSAENIAAFHRWKNEDKAHHKAFEEVLELWGNANVLTRLEPPVAISSVVSAKSPFAFLGLNPSVAKFGAAAFVLLLMVAVFIVQPWNGSVQQVYLTQVGEQKTIELPDGSRVMLNTDSQVLVDYKNDRRLLTLQQGEAHFEVAHDADRPFDVYAGGGVVKALGTAFTVRMDRQVVSVFVTEGVVEVFNTSDIVPPDTVNTSAVLVTAQNASSEALSSISSQNSPKPKTQASGGVKVPAGQQAVYGEVIKKSVNVVVSKGIDEKLSWRKGKLVFKGEPLGGVIEEFSRYTSTKIIIPGKKMRNIKVGGIFEIGDTAAMLDALQDGFGIHAQYVSDDIIYLVFEDDK